MIYYLGYYNCEQIEGEKRIASPPAMNKMGYIISVISEITQSKSIVVSPSETGLNKYVRGSFRDLNDQISINTFDSIHSKNQMILLLYIIH